MSIYYISFFALISRLSFDFLFSEEVFASKILFLILVKSSLTRSSIDLLKSLLITICGFFGNCGLISKTTTFLAYLK